MITAARSIGDVKEIVMGGLLMTSDTAAPGWLVIRSQVHNTPRSSVSLATSRWRTPAVSAILRASVAWVPHPTVMRSVVVMSSTYSADRRATRRGRASDGSMSPGLGVVVRARRPPAWPRLPVTMDSLLSLIDSSPPGAGSTGPTVLGWMLPVVPKSDRTHPATLVPSGFWVGSH